ncbi:MAG: DUF6499 domain-containing protein [Hyphomicrobiaceae bacterium]|nr:hypothetical protein [Hyphomicrobiaceae bacterium]
MATAIVDFGPRWPPALRAYDYLTALTYPQFAWEVLRRNRDYLVAVRSYGAIET